MLKDYIWGYGEIGKHVGLKNQCRKASRFDSGYPYQTSQIKLDKYFGRLFVIFNSTNISDLSKCSKKMVQNWVFDNTICILLFDFFGNFNVFANILSNLKNTNQDHLIFFVFFSFLVRYKFWKSKGVFVQMFKKQIA